MSEERYSKKCYLQLKSHADMGRTNWASLVKNLLYTLGFGYVWQAQEQLGDAKLFLFDVKNRLKDINMQTIHSRIREKSKIYLNYCRIDFYPSTIASSYITTLLYSYSKRRIFTLLRTHSLPIKSNLLRKQKFYIFKV